MDDHLEHAAATAARTVFGPGPEIALAQGAVLMREGDENHRLYLVRSGELRGQSDGTEGAVGFGPGDLIGVPSFFSDRPQAALTVMALSACRLACLERGDREGREAALLPLVVAELVRRQQAMSALVEQERALQERLRDIERITALGQLAAGVAHELNNALAVISRGGSWIRERLPRLVSGEDGLAGDVMAHALAHGRGVSSAGARAAEAALKVVDPRLPAGLRRAVAQMGLPDGLRARVLASPQAASLADVWELGATVRDLAAATTQAGDVARSMRELAAGGELRREDIDLEETVRTALSMLRSQLAGIEVEVACPPSLRLRADHGGLVQVWTNLVRNAAEALRSRLGRRAIAITVHPSGADVVVAVADNGPGIPPSIRDRIFDPSVSTKRPGPDSGLGLGLSIVHRLVIAHAGRIAVDTGPTGTTFTIVLPAGAAP